MPRQRRPAALAPLLAASLLLAACGGSDAVTEPEPEPEPEPTVIVDVFTPGNIFNPTDVELPVNGAIRWRLTESPDGNGHNVFFTRTTPGAPADIPVLKDTSVVRVFRSRGTFVYDCTVHPGMRGEVIVQ